MASAFAATRGGGLLGGGAGGSVTKPLSPGEAEVSFLVGAFFWGLVALAVAIASLVYSWPIWVPIVCFSFFALCAVILLAKYAEYRGWIEMDDDAAASGKPQPANARAPGAGELPLLAVIPVTATGPIHV